MQKLIVSRLFEGSLALLILSMVIFGLVRLMGDPLIALLPMNSTAEDKARLAESLGLDQPLPVQYVRYVASLSRGDFGDSLYVQQPVGDLIAQRLPNSMKLGLAVLAVALLTALPMGVMTAVNKGKWLDSAGQVVGALGQSVPIFWIGLILMQVFSVQFGWLPSNGIGGIEYYILPSVTAGFFMVAIFARLLRSSMLDVLDSDYIRMARVKGLRERTIVWQHAFRNALTPVVTLAGLYIALLVTSLMVVEVVFSWPGMGRLVYEGILHRDFPVVQGVVLVVGAMVIAANLLVDIGYAYLDPRLRTG